MKELQELKEKEMREEKLRQERYEKEMKEEKEKAEKDIKSNFDYCNEFIKILQPKEDTSAIFKSFVE